MSAPFDLLTANDAISAATSGAIQKAEQLVNRDFVVADLSGFAGFVTLSDRAAMYEVLGEERAALPWLKSINLLDVETGEPLPPDTVTLLRGKHHRYHNRLTAWVDVRVAPGGSGAVWIAAGGRDPDTPSVAVAVPRDPEIAVPVRLEAIFEAGSSIGIWPVMSLSAQLGPPAPEGFENVWQVLWELQRAETFASLGEAANAAEKVDALGHALRSRSMLAIAIVLELLLRANRLAAMERLPTTPLNPSIPLFPEFCVLQAARARAWARASGTLSSDRIGPAALSAIAEHGIPLLTPILATAVELSTAWRDGPAPTIEVEAARARIEAAAEFALSDSQFLAFVTNGVQLSPREILASKKEQQPALVPV
jgi:hypothetical protein